MIVLVAREQPGSAEIPLSTSSIQPKPGVTIMTSTFEAARSACAPRTPKYLP